MFASFPVRPSLTLTERVSYILNVQGLKMPLTVGVNVVAGGQPEGLQEAEDMGSNGIVRGGRLAKLCREAAAFNQGYLKELVSRILFHNSYSDSPRYWLATVKKELPLTSSHKSYPVLFLAT